MSEVAVAKGEQARALFEQGYNCAQATFLTFCQEAGMPFEQALRLTSSFGGGMGRLREVCGAVTGMFMAAGLIYGPDDPTDDAAKKAHYARIQQLAADFKARNGTIICRELLGLQEQVSDPTPLAAHPGLLPEAPLWRVHPGRGGAVRRLPAGPSRARPERSGGR